MLNGQSEKRFVYIIRNSLEQKELEELRKLAREYGKRTVRKAEGHVELVVLTKYPLSLLNELSQKGYNVTEVRNVDETPPPNLTTALIDYAYYMWHERYWEAHEVLENIWRSDKDECLAGLINLAASLVKLQEGNLPSHVRIVRRAVGLLQACKQRDYVDGECIFSEIDRALKKGEKPKLHLCLRV